MFLSSFIYAEIVSIFSAIVLSVISEVAAAVPTSDSVVDEPVSDESSINSI